MYKGRTDLGEDLVAFSESRTRIVAVARPTIILYPRNAYNVPVKVSTVRFEPGSAFSRGTKGERGAQEIQLFRLVEEIGWSMGCGVPLCVSRSHRRAQARRYIRVHCHAYKKLFLSMNLDDPNRSSARLVSWIDLFMRGTSYAICRGTGCDGDSRHRKGNAL